LMVRLHLLYLRTQKRFVLNPVLQFCVLFAVYFCVEGGLLYVRPLWLPASVFFASVYSPIAERASRRAARPAISRRASMA
jgi:hypothetical protein